MAGKKENPFGDCRFSKFFFFYPTILVFPRPFFGSAGFLRLLLMKQFFTWVRGCMYTALPSGDL